MSGGEEKTCPLCTEEMDFTDKQLKPCKCGYQICLWCWHHIMNEANFEGRCPACRSPYDGAKIAGMAANCGRPAVGINAEQKQIFRKAKWKVLEGRKDLSNIRVIQRNLVYITGFPLDLANKDLLKRWEYFGKYGKVLKVSIPRPASGFIIQQSAYRSCSVYITYSKEEEAIKCIRSVHNFTLDGKTLRACFGFTRYCYLWLNNLPCNIQDCSFLHDFGSPEDSFNKDDKNSSFSTLSKVWDRVQQIAGGINNTQQYSGCTLPPAEECTIASTSKIKDISNIREFCVNGITRSSNFAEVSLEVSPTIITLTEPFACVPTPETITKSSVASVPITRPLELEKESCCPSLDKDGHLDVELQSLSLLSGSSSVSMKTGLEQEQSIPAVTNCSISIDLSVKNPRAKGSKQHDMNLFKGCSTSQVLEEATTSSISTFCSQKKEDLLSFDDQTPNGSEGIYHPLSVSESFPNNVLKIFTQLISYSEEKNDTFSRNIFQGNPRIIPVQHSEATLPFTSSSSLSSNELRTNRACGSSKSGITIESSSAGLVAEKDEHLGRFDNNIAVDSGVAQDMRESNIISDILPMDLDVQEKSLISPHNLDKFLSQIDDQRGSVKVPNLLKIQNSGQSRFSFARQEDILSQISGSDHSDSNIRSLLNKYSASQNFGLNKDSRFNRCQRISFPSSSVASKDQPICSFTLSNNLSEVPTTRNGTPGFSVLSQASPPMLSSHQLVHLPSYSNDHFLQKSMLLGVQFQGLGGTYSLMNDAYGFPLMVPEQYAAHYPFWFVPWTAQQFRDGYSPNNWVGWNGVQNIDSLGMSELPKIQGPGGKKFVPGYWNLK